MLGARPEEMANAAAEQFECNVGKRLIPRGGLCIHRPADRNAAVAAAAAAPNNVHDDYLTFTRNLFLQTPQPSGDMTIDQIWDDAAEQKFGGVTLATAATTAGKRKGGRKRKAEEQQEGDVDVSSTSPIPPPMKTERDTPIGSDGLVDAKPSAAAAVGEEMSLNHSQPNSSSTTMLPMCGLEDDERMLSFLQANHGGDLEKAKFSIMVNSDRGHGRCPILGIYWLLPVVVFLSSNKFFSFYYTQLSKGDDN